MAIAFGAASDLGNSSGTSYSAAFSTAGSDRYLVVAVIGDTGGGAEDVTGATYAGVSMALLGKISDVNIARFGYFFGLAAPATGSNNVVVSCASGHFLAMGAAYYTGVSQTGQPEVTVNNFSNADADAAVSNAITPLTGDSWVVMGTFGYDFANGAPVAGTGATRRTFEATFGLWGLMDSNAAVPASSYTMAWNYSSGAGSADLGSILIAIAPAGGGGGSTPSPAAGALSLTGTTGRLGFAILMPDEL